MDSVRDLGVTLDSELTLQRHVNKVASLCFYHIGRLQQVCKLLRPSVTTTLVSAFVFNRVDYCNAILAGLPKTTIAPLQSAQNAAARLVPQLGPRDHISNALCHMHWLPVHQRITYKLCLLMHLVHNDWAPAYMADSVTATANISRRTRLRSASSLRYEQPRTRLKLGERCFAFAGPAAWNSLPLYIKNNPTQTPSNGTSKIFIQTILFQFFIIGRFNSFYLYVTYVMCWSCFYNCKRWTLWTYELIKFMCNFVQIIHKLLQPFLTVGYHCSIVCISDHSASHRYANVCIIHGFSDHCFIIQ